MPTNNGAPEQRQNQSQARALNALHDGNCDRCFAPRSVMVPHRAIHYPRFESMSAFAESAEKLSFCIHLQFFKKRRSFLLQELRRSESIAAAKQFHSGGSADPKSRPIAW
jgi:hypothetical protein